MLTNYYFLCNGTGQSDESLSTAKFIALKNCGLEKFMVTEMDTYFISPKLIEIEQNISYNKNIISTYQIQTIGELGDVIISGFAIADVLNSKTEKLFNRIIIKHSMLNVMDSVFKFELLHAINDVYNLNFSSNYKLGNINYLINNLLVTKVYGFSTCNLVFSDIRFSKRSRI